MDIVEPMIVYPELFCIINDILQIGWHAYRGVSEPYSFWSVSILTT